MHGFLKNQQQSNLIGWRKLLVPSNIYMGGGVMQQNITITLRLMGKKTNFAMQ